jgi:phage FluMu protein Com
MNQKQTTWMCSGCGKVLGKRVGSHRLEIKLSRGHQYLATLPVTCVCPRPDCRTLNEISFQSKEQTAPPALSPGQV